jgi:hypothetical protein
VQIYFGGGQSRCNGTLTANWRESRENVRHDGPADRRAAAGPEAEGIAERLPMRDFHATILNLHGLDQNRLWFPRNGPDEELTDFCGNAIQEMPA